MTTLATVFMRSLKRNVGALTYKVCKTFNAAVS